jgi:hypothetical protein
MTGIRILCRVNGMRAAGARWRRILARGRRYNDRMRATLAWALLMCALQYAQPAAGQT